MLAQVFYNNSLRFLTILVLRSCGIYLSKLIRKFFKKVILSPFSIFRWKKLIQIHWNKELCFKNFLFFNSNDRKYKSWTSTRTIFFFVFWFILSDRYLKEISMEMVLFPKSFGEETPWYFWIMMLCSEIIRAVLICT